MAIEEKQIDIKVAAKTTGFPQATKEAQDFGDALTQMGSRAQKAMADLERRIGTVEQIRNQGAGVTKSGQEWLQQNLVGTAAKKIETLRRMGYVEEADLYERRLNPAAANVAENQTKLQQAMGFRLQEAPQYRLSQDLVKFAQAEKDPATKNALQALANEQAKKAISLSASMRQTIMEGLATAKTPQEADEMLNKVIDNYGVEQSLTRAQGLTARGKLLKMPSYFGTAVNMAGQILGSFAAIQEAERTMYNISSPQAAAIAKMQRDITIKKTAILGGAELTGSVIGGLIGGAITPGFPMVGAYLGSYGGGQIAKAIGGSVATFATMTDEQKQVFFSQMFPELGNSMGVLEKTQQSGYGLSRFFTGGPMARFRQVAMQGGIANPKTSAMIGATFMRGPVDAFYGIPEKEWSRIGISPDQRNALSLIYEKLRGSTGGGHALTSLIAYGIQNAIPPEVLFQLAGVQKYTGIDVNSSIFKSLARRTGMAGGREEDLINALLQNVVGASKILSTPQGITSSTYLLGLPGMMFDTRSEAGKLGQEGLQEIMNVSQIAQPKDEAQRAFMIAALANGSMRGRSFMDINLRMRSGAYNQQNLVDMAREIQRRSHGIRDIARGYLAENMPGAGEDLIDRLADLSQKGLLASSIAGLKPLANKIVSPKDIEKLVGLASLSATPQDKQEAGMAEQSLAMAQGIQGQIYYTEQANQETLAKAMNTGKMMVSIVQLLLNAVTDTETQLTEIQKLLGTKPVTPSGSAPNTKVSPYSAQRGQMGVHAPLAPISADSTSSLVYLGSGKGWRR